MSGDIHALSGAYAVDAVDDLERAAFERHLARCETCAEEVASLRGAAAELSQISHEAPPLGLRDRLLAEVETTRPVPPVVSLRRAERSRGRRLPALAAAAVALIALGGAGATVWHPWSPETDQVVQVSAADRVLDASDATTFTQRTGDGVTLSVTHSPSQDRSVLAASGLSPLTDDQVYEMWLKYGDEMVSAGFLKDPTSPVVIQGDVASASLAGVTIEPAGGSPDPSYSNLVGTVALGQA